MGVLTFYPAAGANSPVDGVIYRNDYGTNLLWSQIRDAASGTDKDVTENSGPVGQLESKTTSGKWAWLRRSYYLFNTAALSGLSVVSAILSLFGTGKNDVLSQSIDVVASTPAANDDLALADYSQIADVAFATPIAISAWNSSGYNDFALNASGLANINAAGISKFGGRLSGDRSNTEPSWSASQNCYALAYYADRADTTEDPKLAVTYSEPTYAYAKEFKLKTLYSLEPRVVT